MRTYIISLCCSVAMIFGVFGCGPTHKKDIILTQSDLQYVKRVAVIVEQKHNFEYRSFHRRFYHLT